MTLITVNKRSVEDCVLAFDPDKNGKAMQLVGNGVDVVNASLHR